MNRPTAGDAWRAGRVGVRADGSLTIGTRWNLQTPVEPIDRADLGIDVGVPHE